MHTLILMHAELPVQWRAYTDKQTLFKKDGDNKWVVELLWCKRVMLCFLKATVRYETNWGHEGGKWEELDECGWT